MTALFDSGVWISLSPSDQETLWQHCTMDVQNPILRWHRYIDQLCVQSVLPWLRDMLETKQPIRIVSIADDRHGGANAEDGNITPHSPSTTRPSLVLETEDVRFVVIPSEAIDRSELRVPDAWVHDPHQSGDYYLTVQVDPDEGQVHIWGYASHTLLTQQGHYDPLNGSYSMEQDALLTDFAVLAVTHQLGMAHSLANTRQPSTDPTMARTSHAAASIPVVPQAMGQRIRQTLDQGIAAIDLRQWLHPNSHQTLQVQGWELLEHLFSPASEEALAFRWTSWANDGAGKYSRGKRITLNRTDNRHLYLFLLVRVAAEEDGRLAIRVQLRPETLEATLLDGVCLALVSPDGDVIQSVYGRAIDSYIQLKRFRLSQGTNFGIQVALNDAVVTESFRIGQSNY